MAGISLLTAALAFATSSLAAIDESAFAECDIITKDVVIIGGGASGTYAAVRLREDYNVSIELIEIDDHLGGHVNTWIDPANGGYINYGVQGYTEYGGIGGSEAFFKRFGIPTVGFVPNAVDSVYIDSSNGANLSAYIPPTPNATFSALAVWQNFTAQFNDIMLPGYWNFPNGSDIPPVLLEPFGEVSKRYGFEPLYPDIALVSNVGIGGVDDILTLYVIMAFGNPISNQFTSIFVPVNASNSLLYNKAYNLLKKDVLLQSRVVDGERSADGVKLVVKSVNGTQKLIKAKEMLFTPPPSASNLAPFEPDTKETSLLSTWTGTWSFAGVAYIPQIPGNWSVTWIAPQAAPTDYDNIHAWPWSLSLASTGPGGVPDSESLYQVLFATNYSISDTDAKATIAQAVHNLTSPGGAFPSSTPTNASSLDWKAFVNHNSILWRQPAELIYNGFIQDLYSLQGHRSTWYTGGLWSEDYSGNVWAFTDTVLPKMVAALA